MKIQPLIAQNEMQMQLIEGSRVGLFIVILLTALLSYLIQPAFINWTVLGAFYALISVSLFLHFFYILFSSKLFQHPRLLFFTFIVDAALISSLIYYSGLNQSLFIFIHLVHILLVGLVFRTEGALIVALLTSLFFTMATILGPEIKAFSYIFMLALNNIAFFLVAGLSGYLSEQLYSVGQELQRTGLSLRAAQELNRLIMAHIPSGIISFNGQGEVLQFNPAAEAILVEKQLQSKNIFDLLKDFKVAETQELQTVDLKYVVPDGSETKVLGIMTSGFYSPELQTQIRIMQIDDLTKIRKLEWGLRQAEKMSAIGQLAAGIAHEIRNPLSGISGSVELLSQSAQNDDDRKLMSIILREIDRLNKLITEFLEFSRPEAVPTDPVDLVHLVDDVMLSLQNAKNLRTDIQWIKTMPVQMQILGQSEKLKQAFLNIMINSCQAMENTLHPRLEISLERVGSEAHMKIKDNGCGMSEAVRKRMFEPFHTTKAKGTGLGLAITHKILEGHGAKVFVESKEGQGTEFALVFPARPVAS